MVTDKRGLQTTPSGTLAGPQRADARKSARGNFCRCGAWRGVFGLEPTPELYLEHTLLIFREAWRVLRKDGTLWVNLGDSYASDTKWGGATGGKHVSGLHGQEIGRAKRFTGLKGGDLVGIPWRVALALQQDGWYLRRDNIWFKPNPMPESVNGWRWEKHRVKTKDGRRKADWKVRPKGWQAGEGSHDKIADGNYRQNGIDQSVPEYIDCPGCEKCAPNSGLILRKGNWRCTTSHEYVFQFSKSASYFCDAEAARERTTGGAHSRGHGVNPKAKMPVKNSRIHVDRDVAHASKVKKPRQNESFSAAVAGLVGNRNLRSVWRISTKPYHGAHFATFPPALIRPIILAASPVKCCGSCGAPYAPVLERGEPRREQQLECGSDVNGDYFPTGNGKYYDEGRVENSRTVKQRILAGMVEKKVVGFRRTCSHEAEAVAATVLDMFGGSGTVGQVAHEEGRDAILIELSTEYIPLIEKRCAVTAGLGL